MSAEATYTARVDGGTNSDAMEVLGRYGRTVDRLGLDVDAVRVQVFAPVPADEEFGDVAPAIGLMRLAGDSRMYAAAEASDGDRRFAVDPSVRGYRLSAEAPEADRARIEAEFGVDLSEAGAVERAVDRVYDTIR